MLNPQQLLLALSTQASALWLLVGSDNGLGRYLAFLALHGVASALWGLMCWALLPVHLRQPRVQVLALMVTMAFFIPMLGAACLLLATWAARWYPLMQAKKVFGTVEVPQFQDAGSAMQQQRRRLRENTLGRLLSDARLDPALRSRALNALSGMAPRVSARLLRQLLGDPVEDLRLVAYGLLDRAEKRLRDQIGKLEQQLADGQVHAVAANRALAELHFELVQQHLVQGDLRTHALKEATGHLNLAMELSPGDGGLLQLRGRIRMEQGALEDAQGDLRQAQQAGWPDARTAPWLAEVAFLQGQWGEVREALSTLSAKTQTPRMAAAVRYWTGQEEPRSQWSQLGRRSSARPGSTGRRSGDAPPAPVVASDTSHPSLHT